MVEWVLLMIKSKQPNTHPFCTVPRYTHLADPIQIPKHVLLTGVYVVLILCRWDQRSSVVTPDEDIFYLVALLRSALDTGDETHTLEHLTNQNRQILKFCDDAGIKVKQYLPHYTTQEEWMDHFGDKWGQFYQWKMDFDPRHILATGQRIFSPSSSVPISNHGGDKLLSISWWPQKRRKPHIIDKF